MLEEHSPINFETIPANSSNIILSSKNVEPQSEDRRRISELPVQHLDTSCGIESDMLKIADQFEQEFYADSCVKKAEKSTTLQLQGMHSEADEKSYKENPCPPYKEKHPNQSYDDIQVESKHDTGFSSKKDQFNSLVQESITSTGFTTASKKPLKCSSNALKKAKILFDKLDDKELMPTTSSEKSIHFKQLCEYPADKQCDVEKIHFKTNNTELGEFSGFKTASNKTLSVSAQGMQKANLIFASLPNEEDVNQCTSKRQKEIDQGISKEVSSHSLTVGFKTASNKSVTISSAAWKRGEEFMKTAVDESTTEDQVLHKNIVAHHATTISNQNLQTNLGSFNIGTNNYNSVPRNKRLSLPATSNINSPLFKPVKGKRRNSFYKPPRKKPLQEVLINVPVNSHSNVTPANVNSDSTEKISNKKQLGVRHDQENQIYVSDESLLKAMALFEQV